MTPHSMFRVLEEPVGRMKAVSKR